MKFANLYCKIAFLFILTSTIGYNSLAVGDDRVIENPYILRINGIPFRDDVAEGILLRISNEYQYKSIRVYDNVGKNYILLSSIKEGLDVNYEGSELLSVLSEMYKGHINSIKNIHLAEDTTRISREVIINKRLVKIQIDVDNHDSSVTHFMLYPKASYSTN